MPKQTDDPLNAWSEVLFPLANDCLAWLISWEEYQQYLAEEAARLGFAYEPATTTGTTALDAPDVNVCK